MRRFEPVGLDEMRYLLGEGDIRPLRQSRPNRPAGIPLVYKHVYKQQYSSSFMKALEWNNRQPI